MEETAKARANELNEQGYAVIPGALAPEVCESIDQALRKMHASGHEHGANDVGTLWFDDVLNVAPETFTPLIGHPSVAPLLWILGGRQVQLRSLRGHLYLGRYEQHWHMDFYGYWDQAEEGLLACVGLAVNTTFYLQDGGPGSSCLQFVRGGHLARPQGLRRDQVRATEANEFTRWCDQQERVTLYPGRGDCVVFFSHLPHRGLKIDPTSERSNVVCHYQLNPFHSNVWFLSEALGDQGIYPFAAGAPVGTDA